MENPLHHLEIRCPSGLAIDTEVLLDGKPLHGVTRFAVDLSVEDVTRVTLDVIVQPMEIVVGGLKMERLALRADRTSGGVPAVGANPNASNEFRPTTTDSP